ncbi:MAG: hypothetical protein ABIQ40_09895 [Bacteroidia bacterium]
MKRFLLLSGIAFIFALSACDNGSGPGGQATITGKVYIKGNWNSACTLYADTSTGYTGFYAPDADVYLIYGDEPTYGDRVKTAPDGTFQFKYLRKGSYTVYAYSKDCAAQSGTSATTTIVEITEKKQEVVLSNLDINK